MAFTKKTMTMVVPVEVDPRLVVKEFDLAVARLQKHEVRSFYWIPELFVKEKLAHNVVTKDRPFKFYHKVRTLLMKLPLPYSALVSEQASEQV